MRTVELTFSISPQTVCKSVMAITCRTHFVSLHATCVLRTKQPVAVLLLICVILHVFHSCNSYILTFSWMTIQGWVLSVNPSGCWTVSSHTQESLPSRLQGLTLAEWQSRFILADHGQLQIFFNPRLPAEYFRKLYNSKSIQDIIT